MKTARREQKKIVTIFGLAVSFFLNLRPGKAVNRGTAAKLKMRYTEIFLNDVVMLWQLDSRVVIALCFFLFASILKIGSVNGATIKHAH